MREVSYSSLYLHLAHGQELTQEPCECKVNGIATKTITDGAKLADGSD